MSDIKTTEAKRVMTENPLNAETSTQHLRTWITPNKYFFSRNQSRIMTEPVDIDAWSLTIEGEVKKTMTVTYDQILKMPRVVVANTFECSGNGRSLLRKSARGNPWTIGGVGNAVWGGVWLHELLEEAGLQNSAGYVAFEGFDKSGRSAGIDFVRSIPIEKAMSSTLLAYEMNGEPLPEAHGYPLRGLPLGWTGANCVKWLRKITVMDRPFEGYFMDKVYRVYHEGQQPTDGEPVTEIPLKSIITQPSNGEEVSRGRVVVLGAAYGGGQEIAGVDISLDRGSSWTEAELIGPGERYAWRQFQYVHTADTAGELTVMARAKGADGRMQPLTANWNVLGYGNDGVEEHSVTIRIV